MRSFLLSDMEDAFSTSRPILSLPILGISHFFKLQDRCLLLWTLYHELFQKEAVGRNPKTCFVKNGWLKLIPLFALTFPPGWTYFLCGLIYLEQQGWLCFNRGALLIGRLLLAPNCQNKENLAFWEYNVWVHFIPKENAFSFSFF